MRILTLICLLSFAIGCIDRQPTQDDDLDAATDARLPDFGLVDAALADAAEPLPDATVADAAAPDLSVPDARPPEPIPMDEPARVRLLGFSADDRYLFIARIDPAAPDDRAPESGQLERHDVATGARVVIDTQVILAIPNQPGVLFDARGETVVYAKRAFDVPTNEAWLERVAPTFYRWTADGRVRYGRASRVMLDTGGRRLLAWPWEADFIEALSLPDERVFRMRVPRRVAAWENSVVLGDDVDVSVFDLGTGERRELASGAALIRQAGQYALLNEDGQLVVHDLVAGERLVAPIEAPRAIAFFTMDRGVGRAVIGVGQGAYGAIRTWALDADQVTEVAMPDAREAGGNALATGARLHAEGLVYYPHATWVGRDMWDLRGGTATRVQTNNCTDRPLPGRDVRLVIGSALGCATLGPRQISLYDEATLTLTATGLESRGIWALLADGRVVFNDGTSGAGMIWDIDADTVEPLGGQIDRAQTRRDGTWMIALLHDADRAQRTIVVVHPEGIAHHPVDESVLQLIATDTHVAWVVPSADGDVVEVRGLDAMR